MQATINKKELTDWIERLDDRKMLLFLRSLKDSYTVDDWWDEIPNAVKKGIEKGEADVQAGRVHPSEDVWEEIQRRRKQRS